MRSVMTVIMRKLTGFTGSHAKLLNLMISLHGHVAQIPFGPQVVKDYPEVQSFVRFINMPRAVV